MQFINSLIVMIVCRRLIVSDQHKELYLPAFLNVKVSEMFCYNDCGHLGFNV